MTEENVQEMQDKALGQYTRLKQTLAQTDARVKAISKEMREISYELESKPSSHFIGMNWESKTWLNIEAVKAALADVERARREMQTAKDKAISLGVAIPND